MVPLSEWGECPGGFFFKDTAKREVLRGDHLFQRFALLLRILNCCKGSRLRGSFDIYLIRYTYIEGVSLVNDIILGEHDKAMDESFLSFIIDGRDVWEWNTFSSGSISLRMSLFVGNKVCSWCSRASPLIIKGELTVWEAVME